MDYRFINTFLGEHKLKTKYLLTLVSLVVISILILALPCHPRVPSSKLEAETPAEEVVKKIKKELVDMLTQASIPGAAVAVVDDRTVLWEEAYGKVDGPDSGPIDMNTLFSIQSMSKSFTALAVLMAVQDGMVELDIPITEYLPDFTVKSRYEENPEKIITLRHLLSHWSGLTNEAPFGSNQDDRYDFAKHIESISSTWLRYPVGYRYYYSNLGIDLAGYILQVRSGEPFAEYVKEEVLDPIGMSRSLCDMDAIEQINNRAIGHANNRVPQLRIPMIPAGGLYSNINDMVKYLQFHLHKGAVNERRLLRADLMGQMHTIQFARSLQRFGYCLGLIRCPVSDSYCIYHAGAGYGFSSIMVMFPEKKTGVVLLTNSENESVIWNLLNMVIECVSEKCGEAPVEEPEIERMIKLDPKNPRGQAVIGRYGDVFEYIIEMKNDSLVLRMMPENRSYPLDFYDDDGELVGLFGNFSELRFLPPYHGQRGSVMRINRRLSDSNFNIKDFNDSPTDPPGPDEPHWSEYVGDYEHLINGTPSGIFSVTIRNGYLYVAECKCTEYRRGLFFCYDGLPIDFSTNPPTASYIPIRKKE
jgi:CubicO group peptidase (beta-lactamase class C family)